VLKNNRIGEIHKGVTMLTVDDGLLSAIAHGAYSQKGKLRGTTNLFCTGTVYLYTDPVRDSVKITDFDVERYFSSIREDLSRFYTASLWAESVLKTFATGGDSSRLFVLLVDALSQLDASPPERAPLLSIHFIWRFLELSGSQPDLDHCARSGDALDETQPVYYSSRDAGFCSPAYADESMARWSPGIVAYLRHSGVLAFTEALNVVPPADSVVRMKRVLYEILQEHVETPLQSLRSGSGIL
jgi:DNA repair protein RecO (recombination protein O)